MKFLLSSLIFLTALSLGKAGEKPTLYLTGNPKIDFFSTPNFSTTDCLLFDTTRPELPTLLWTEQEKEKSPWIAALMSLAVPGAGEFYTENYLKAGLFFAAEVTFWTIVYNYNRKGDHQTQLYKDYANRHWSAVRYTNWVLDHLNHLNPTNPNLRTREEYSDLIYGDNIPPTPQECSPPFHCINWAALNAMERDIANGYTNGFTHTLPSYGEQQYYELIGKYDQFSRGWDDSDPQHQLENEIPIRSTSKRFYEYARMRAKANEFYDVASTWVNVAIVNHVLSAIDAFWSAKQYNKTLHAHMRTRIIPTQLGMIPVPELNVRYDF